MTPPARHENSNNFLRHILKISFIALPEMSQTKKLANGWARPGIASKSRACSLRDRPGRLDFSKLNLHRELQLPGCGAQSFIEDLAADVWVVKVRRQSELRVEGCGRARIDMVEGVEGIDPELKRRFLSN